MVDFPNSTTTVSPVCLIATAIELAYFVEFKEVNFTAIVVGEVVYLFAEEAEFVY